MTLGQARAATSPELALYRTPGKWAKVRAAVYPPATVFTARVNQAFTAWDQLLEIVYDGSVGSTSNVKADMTLLVGSTAGAHDKGITRVRSIDGSKVYIGETSDIKVMNDDYLTIIADFGLWAKHMRISGSTFYMDGTITYSNQHASPDPIVIAGGTRVLRLTGASVSTQYDLSASYVVGGMSTITGYSTACATAASITDPTTSAPTLVFDTAGWHVVYITCTAANGKSFTTVRLVFVEDPANPPPSVLIGENGQDAETGGWRFDLTMFGNCDLTSIRDRAYLVVYSEDHFGNTQQDIGLIPGCENIEVDGWIAGESIDWNPERGVVKFTAYNAQYWFSKIPAYPDGVELVASTPARWTEFQALTVDKGLWHFLHWRSTATRIMDVFLTGDTKYTKEVSSQAGNLWEQIREMGFAQIFARPGVNNHNQLFIQVHPQLVPLADRTWATVMTITKNDWVGTIDLERIIVPPNACVNLSGVAVNSKGNGVPYFSLSPGHTYPHYGTPEQLDNLLVASQAQSNSLAGLYRGWLNNPYGDISVPFKFNIRLVDCFPRQKCAIVIDAADTPRGIAYSGNVIPKAIHMVQDPETGSVTREVVFEAETFEDLAIKSIPPGASSTTPSIPKLKFPPLPDLSELYPGDISGTPYGPPVVPFLDDNEGMLFTQNFDAEDGNDVIWQFSNGGIDQADIPNISDFYITPNGSVWVVVGPTTVYYAPALGSVFTKVIDSSWFAEKYPTGYNYFIAGFGVNYDKPEEVGMIAGWNDFGPFVADTNLWIGDHTGFTEGAACTNVNYYYSSLTYGGGKWVATNEQFTFFGFFDNHLWRFSGDGMTLEYEVALNSSSGAWARHVRAATSERIYVTGSDFETSDDNGDNVTLINPSGLNAGQPVAVDPTGQYLLGVYGAGKRGKSSDYGSSWSTLANLLPGADFFRFAYAGGVGVASRWIAGSGTIWYSADVFGAETWVTKAGNLTNLIITPAIVKIIVPGYC